ncbi:MAG: hypothetical protein WAV68_04050 [Candidatus Nanogingivalis sp.]
MKEKLIRLAPILLIVAIAILSIILIVNLGRMMFGFGDSSNKSSETSQQEQDTSTKELLTVETGRSVKMTVRGPIVANEDARSYIVEVSPSGRLLKVLKGYNGEVINQKDYANTSVSYDEFVHALNKANMMKGEAFTGEADDLRGVCASGYIYDFAILKNGEVVKHLWTSTCGGSKGSLLANTKQLQDLFASQIPEFKKVVNDLGVSNL